MQIILLLILTINLFGAVQTQEDFHNFKREFHTDIIEFHEKYIKYLDEEDKLIFKKANANILTAMMKSTSFYKADQFAIIYLTYKRRMIDIILKDFYAKQKILDSNRKQTQKD
jgi:hypothetical protein